MTPQQPSDNESSEHDIDPSQAERDRKFVENINDVLISLNCCVVEHRLKSDTYFKFDNRALGKHYSLPRAVTSVAECRLNIIKF